MSRNRTSGFGVTPLITAMWEVTAPTWKSVCRPQDHFSYPDLNVAAARRTLRVCGDEHGCGAGISQRMFSACAMIGKSRGSNVVSDRQFVDQSSRRKPLESNDFNSISIDLRVRRKRSSHLQVDVSTAHPLPAPITDFVPLVRFRYITRTSRESVRFHLSDWGTSAAFLSAHDTCSQLAGMSIHYSSTVLL